MLVNESQIRALIKLLADEDEKIVQTISGKLIDIGPSAVPLLQEAEIEQPPAARDVGADGRIHEPGEQRHTADAHQRRLGIEP